MLRKLNIEMSSRHGVWLKYARGSATALVLVPGSRLKRVLPTEVHNALQGAVQSANTKVEIRFINVERGRWSINAEERRASDFRERAGSHLG